MTRIDVLVQVQPDGDEETDELLDLTDGLREELLTLDVDDVRPVEASEAPDGAKGLAAVAGWLAVQLASADVLRAAVDALRGWATQRRRDVEVTIGGDTLKLSRVSAGEQERIIDAWIARHSAGT
ncbi:effector-associated constant component EACC1 [Knoellia sp. CPCC 206450]|uniref:effector-associated constant component EACC1 n=1 Tax=Knoellia tibetensis TaxID=3404798 RepID=UPI003B43406E